MTCKEMLMQEHPEWDEREIRKTVLGSCPSKFNYMRDPLYCGEDGPCHCYQCWDRVISESESLEGLKAAEAFTEGFVQGIKDSGDRTEFATGAVRDMREGKGRCDLMPLEVVSHFLETEGMDDQVLALIRIFQRTGSTEALYLALDEFRLVTYKDRKTMLLEVAKHFEEGAKKYGENNWQKGIPVHCYIDSAVRHYLKWLRGDKDEPHDRAFVWNLMCCIWEVDYRELGNAKEEK